MKFNFNKYRFVEHGNEVIAISTYAGHTVRGRAKCDPRDAHDPEFGKKLAAARCNEKVSERRAKRARKKLIEAQAQLDAARNHYKKMARYLTDANNDLVAARREIREMVD